LRTSSPAFLYHQNRAWHDVCRSSSILRVGPPCRGKGTQKDSPLQGGLTTKKILGLMVLVLLRGFRTAIYTKAGEPAQTPPPVPAPMDEKDRKKPSDPKDEKKDDKGKT
ncbi:MAG: hypothetical protein AABY90_08505, partial [Nitrospirota bacterium]